MIPTSPADRFVLEEFRLVDGASHAAVDLMLAAADPAGVPLLTSIADDRDVVSVRCVPAHAAPEDDRLDHSTFDALVSGWGPVRTYRRRIAESSLVQPTGYHLAVTESGINDGHRTLARRAPDPAAPAPDARAIDLLWIGVPEETRAGLLVLIGDGGPEGGGDPGWPIPLSDSLGVRIYTGSART